MYILRYIHNVPTITEYHGKNGVLMLHYHENMLDAYRKRRNDPRWQNLRVYQYQYGEEVDITDIVNKSTH